MSSKISTGSITGTAVGHLAALLVAITWRIIMAKMSKQSWMGFFFKTPCIEKEEQTTAVRGSAIWGNQNLPPQPPDMVPLWLLWIDQPRTCRCLVGRPLQSPQGLTLLQCYNGVGEYCNIKWRNQVEACLHYLFSLDHAYSECWMWPFNNQWIPTKKGAFSHFSLGFCIYNVSFVVMKTNDVEKRLKRALI